MTRNKPRNTAARMLMALTPAMLVGGVATALVAGPRGAEAVAGETTTTVAPVIVPVDCLTEDLTGTVIGQDGSATTGPRTALLKLTNTSGQACQVHGWAEVAMVTPPGELVEVPTTMTGTGTADVFVVEPDASAWALLEWDRCASTNDGCDVGVALQFSVDPEADGSVADPEKLPEADGDGITMTALRVGPLRPTPEMALS
ncbi:DUF4232 domain-containing protein [Actinoplanes sp. G11-F43]|uniref:DUF4232 domain-containing protein n=1 Tax=Actinoplanes sp. G11-F43 TaxID=3424130 RepID=UPI003D324BAA